MLHKLTMKLGKEALADAKTLLRGDGGGLISVVFHVFPLVMAGRLQTGFGCVRL